MAVMRLRISPVTQLTAPGSSGLAEQGQGAGRGGGAGPIGMRCCGSWRQIGGKEQSTTLKAQSSPPRGINTQTAGTLSSSMTGCRVGPTKQSRRAFQTHNALHIAPSALTQALRAQFRVVVRLHGSQRVGGVGRAGQGRTGQGRAARGGDKGNDPASCRWLLPTSTAQRSTTCGWLIMLEGHRLLAHTLHLPCWSPNATSPNGLPLCYDLLRLLSW